MVVSFLAAVEVSAAVWYADGQVAASGTGTSWAEAKKTIQEAIAAAVNGDEIWAKQGTYPLATTVTVNKQVKVYGGFSGSETILTQRNWGRRPTILDGLNARTCVIMSSKAARLDGFHVTKGASVGGISVGSGASSSTLAEATFITNCAIYNNGGSVGVQLNGFVGVVSNSLIYHNTGGGIALLNSAWPAIVNCTIYGNTSSSSDGGAGISHFMDSYTYVRNCIIWGNTAAGGSVSVQQVYKYGGSSSYQYCDVQGGISGTGNINSDPLFVKKESYNLHLRAGSPCIDAGTNTPTSFNGWAVLPATDYDGNPRMVDGNNDKVAKVDIGAYEYVTNRGVPLLLLLDD